MKKRHTPPAQVRRNRLARWSVAAIFASLAAAATSAFAQTATFNPTSGAQNYNTAGNWSPATVPNSIGATANFTNSPTAAETVSTSASTIVGTVNLTNNGTFAFTLANGSGGSLAFQVSSGNAAFNVSGTGTVVNVLSAPASLTSTLDFTISDTSVVTSTGALQITGALTGAGGLIKDGDGTMSFASNAKTYTGATVINAGILRTSAAGEATMTSGVTVNSGGTLLSSGGTIQFGTSSATTITLNGTGTTSYLGVTAASPVGALFGAGGGTIANNIVLASNSLVSATGGALTLSGNISGSGALSYSGASTLILSGTNGFGGGLNVNATEVDVAADASLGKAGGSISINGGRLAITSSGTIDSTRGIFLGANSTGSNTGTTFSTPTSGNVVVYNGVFQDLNGSTVGDLVKQGGGTLQLGGASTYSGNTFLNNGITQLTTGNNRLPTGTTLNLGQAGSSGSSGSNNVGALDLNGFNQQIAGLSSTTYLGTGTLPGKNTVTSSTGASILTLNVSGSNSDSYGGGTTANSGVIAGPISIVKTGTGTQTLGDTNTYTGSTQIGGGTLVLSSTGSINGSTLVQVGVAGTTTTNVGALTLTNATALGDTSTLSLVSGTTLNLNAANGTSETIGNLILDGTTEPANTYTYSQLMALDPNVTFTSGFGETLTVTAVPEPATVFGGLLLVGALGWSQRRRLRGLVRAPQPLV